MSVVAAKAQALARALALLLLTAVLGAVVGLCSVGFIEISSWLFSRGVGAAGAHWILLLALPAGAGLLSGLLCMRTVTRSPPGPAEVVRAKSEGLRLLSVRDGIRGVLASFGGLAMGGSVGAYGPLVHMGSTLAAQITHLVAGRKAHEIGLGCGCAAAIAAAFNAPLAGIVFAHEVILKHYSLRLFAPVASAALLANLVTRHALDRPPFLEAVFMSSLSASESAIFALVGLACGLLACAIIHGCLWLVRWHRQFKTPPWLFPTLGGLSCGALAVVLGVPEILGGGKPLLDLIAADGIGSGEQVVLLLVAKFAATLLCIGFGMAGGLFSPALVIGALFGYAIGLGLETVFPTATFASAYIYALVGMFATAAPVIGAPLAGILIAVEFSQSYPLAVSVAVAIVVSSFIAGRLAGGSYYQLQLKRSGIHPEAGPEQRELAQIKLRNRMQIISSADQEESLASALRINVDKSVWDALDVASAIPGERLAVVDDDDQIIGMVTVEELLLEHARLNRRYRKEEGQL